MSVTKAAEGYCGTESGVGLSGVLPIGAAVQRARGTYLAELDFSDPQGLDPQIGLQRDGIHLSFEVGRYIAALTAAEVLVPDGMRTDEYRLPDMRPSPVIGELPAEYGEIARESAAKAVSTMNRGGDGRYYAVNMINSYRTSPVDTAAEDAQWATPSIRNAADLDGAVTAWCEALLKYNGIRKVEVSIVPDDGVSLDDGVLCGKAHLSFGYMSTDVSVRAIYRSDSFADVSDNVWYCEHVVYAYAHGLINGMSPTAFEPNTRMSRAMLVTVLWRLEGAPEADGESAFTDLTQDWYRAAVEWANGAGIVLGVSSDRFAPDEDVTREQIAAVMYRYAEYKGMDTSVRARLDAFRDAGEISDWARDAISFAVRIGLMKGMSETTFNPRGYATRAEVVTILHRYMEM